MLVKDVMYQKGASILSNATVLEAATLMVNIGVGALPAIDEQGFLVGIVSEADIIPHVILGTAASGTQAHRVADIMTRDAVSVDENASLKSAIELMTARHLKAVPVCRDRTVVGLLSRLEIMRVIVSQAAAGSPQGQDDALRRSVIAAVKGHRWSLAQRFDVIVKDGTVHLWGVVPSVDVHTSYCEAAEKAPLARSVVSHMHVMPHGVRMSQMF